MNKKTIKDFFEKNAVSLAIPLVMIIVGLFFILFPGSAISITVKVIGIVFVIIGAIMACTLIAAYSPITMSIAILLIVFGIICIAAPGFIASFIVKTIGIMILINAVLRIRDAYMIKGKSDSFIQYIINDVITLVLGIVLIAIPLNVAGTIVMIIGVFMIVLGLSNIITVIKIYRDGRYVEDGSDVVWEE
jgi:uncharacterized membrane protein HdeD (DUF308 family)